MVFEHIEKLKQEYTDKYVTIGELVPELKRFEGKTGIVRTVNMSGRALVEFLGSTDISWYDIDVDYLKIIDKPLEPVAEEKPRKKVVANDATPATPPPGKARPATTGPSTADILAMARGKKAQAAASEKPAESPTKKPSPGKKPSTADILAMARGKKKPATDQSSQEPPADAPPAKEKAKPSTADILAMARNAKKKSSEDADNK